MMKSLFNLNPVVKLGSLELDLEHANEDLAAAAAKVDEKTREIRRQTSPKRIAELQAERRQLNSEWAALGEKVHKLSDELGRLRT